MHSCSGLLLCVAVMWTMWMGELSVLLALEVSVSHLLLLRAPAFLLLMLLLLLLLLLSVSGSLLIMALMPKSELLMEGAHMVMSMAILMGSLELLLLASL